VFNAQNGVNAKLIAEVSTGFRLLSIAATCLTSRNAGSAAGEVDDEEVAEAESASSAASDGEDAEQSKGKYENLNVCCGVDFLMIKDLLKL